MESPPVRRAVVHAHFVLSVHSAHEVAGVTLETVNDNVKDNKNTMELMKATMHAQHGELLNRFTNLEGAH